jgi:hypothetical protein
MAFPVIGAAYALQVNGLPEGGYAALLAYTTSQVLPDPLPVGAQRMGHKKPFLLYSGRLALLPVNSDYFPHLETPTRGIIGYAPRALRAALKDTAIDLMRRRPEAIERLGPLWPGKRTR